MKKNNPRLEDKGRGNSHHFENAYWQVMAQIDAPEESINALLPLMYDSFEAGLSPAKIRYLAQYLPDGKWRWPEYDRQMKENMEKEIEDDDEEPYIPSNKELLQVLVNRIWRLAHGYGQCQRINSAMESFPYLILDVPEPDRAKPECIEHDGKPYRIDSEFWKRGIPPCERIDCLCGVRQANERMLQQRGLKVVDK